MMLLIAMQQQTKVHFLQQTTLENCTWSSSLSITSSGWWVHVSLPYPPLGYAWAWSCLCIRHCVNVCICVYLPICLKPNSNLFRLCWGNIWAICCSQYDIEECVHDKGRNMFRSAKRVLLGLFGGGTDQLLAWLLLWTQWEKKMRNCPCSLRIGEQDVQVHTYMHIYYKHFYGAV